MKRLLAALLLCAPVSVSAQYTHSLPLSQSIAIDLNTTPIVTVGPRTQDFTPFLANEWMAFLWWEAMTPPAPSVHRYTLALRARDGLASFVGNFGTSPTGWINSAPTFTPGTTDLLMFDVEIAGAGTYFDFTATDLQGDTRTATLVNPGGAVTVAPEPATLALVAGGLLALVAVKRRRA